MCIRDRMTRISDNMFRARVQQLKGLAYREYENEAFRLMRDGLTASALAKRQQPHLSVSVSYTHLHHSGGLDSSFCQFLNDILKCFRL